VCVCVRVCKNEVFRFTEFPKMEG